MELTYKVRTPDGAEFGPATLDHVKNWLREGRISAETEVTRSDIDYWVAAAKFTELEIAQLQTPPVVAATVCATPAVTARPAAMRPLAAPQPRVSDIATVAQMKSGASWFYWIAGLSLINTVCALTGFNLRFIFGLGITTIFDAFAQVTELGASAKAIIIVLDLLAAGMFVLFGVFGNKAHTWAFLVGMILYLLDAGLCLFIQDWLSAAFHAYALFRIFSGFQGCRELKAAA